MSVIASVVVPSYLGAARLPALLDSLAAQEHGTPNFEVIVVIDGVDDGSLALVEAEDRFVSRAILFPENRGRVAALNTGFSAALGRILIRCDDDLVVPPTFINAHIAAHESVGAVGVVGLTYDRHVDSPYARAYGFQAAARSFAGAVNRAPAERWSLWAANCSITRQSWEEIGPYDTAYRAYGWEDIDFGYRLHAAGVPLVVAEGATSEHCGPARTVHQRTAKAYASGAARRTFHYLHPEAPLPQPTPGEGLWGIAVRVAARTTGTADRVARTARLIDTLLPLTPEPFGRRLVALAVEAAGYAGSRGADEDAAHNLSTNSGK